MEGTGYEYDGNVFVAWVLQVRRAEAVTKWFLKFDGTVTIEDDCTSSTGSWVVDT
jgi:hypothetical protein